MKNKTKISLTIGNIALICLALLEFPTTLGQNPIEWTQVSSSPTIWNYAVGVTAAGDSIYIANSKTSGDWESKFMRYNTSAGQWDILATPTQSFKNSIAMAWDQDNYIYALLGASYGDIDGGGRFYFFRYNIATNTWTQLQDTPHTNGPGDAMCFVPGRVLNVSNDNFLYAILGSHKPSGSKFYRYNITTNSWSSSLSFPWDETDDGCSVVWTGGNYLYALRGEWEESTACYNFWRYNIVNDTWESRAEIPAYPHSGGSGGVGDGGSLLWVGDPYSDHIYALSGNQAWPENPYPIWDTRFYLYFISNDTWKPRLADLPAGVGDQNGPRLGFANGGIYCWRGCNNSGDLYKYQLDVTPPQITIISPENKTYRSSSVHLNFTVNESTSWMGYSLDGKENQTITGNTTLTNLHNGSHNIIVYARDYAGNEGASEKVYFTLSTIHEFTLATLYMVHLNLNETFLEGSNLTVIFCSYSSNNQEANTTIWNHTTTYHVNLTINITHPLNKPVENATLVLTDDLGNILQTVTNFVVHRPHLMGRLGELDYLWTVPGANRTAIMKEYVAIDGQWPYAPP